jgi:hypothetical protein
MSQSGLIGHPDQACGLRPSGLVPIAVAQPGFGIRLPEHK